MNRSFIVVFVIVFILYFLPELLFEDAMLYSVGGITGATLMEILKAFVANPSHSLILIIWGITLLGFIGLFFLAKRRYLKCVFGLIIALLLYIIDIIYIGTSIFDVQKIELVNSFFSIIVILSKSFILSIILYYGCNYNVLNVSKLN